MLGYADAILASTTFTDFSFTNFRINVVAPPGTVAGDEAAYTSSLSVTLTLDVAQSAPQATIMRFKNWDGTNVPANCGNSTTGFTDWENIATTKNWNLAAGGNGPRFVCAQINTGTTESPGPPVNIAPGRDSITYAALPVAFFDTFEQPGDTARHTGPGGDLNALILGWVDSDGNTGTFSSDCHLESGSGTEFAQLGAGCSMEQKGISTANLQDIKLDYGRVRCGRPAGGTGNLDVYWKLSTDLAYILLVTDPPPTPNPPPFQHRTESFPGTASNTSIDLKFQFPGTVCVNVDDVKVYGVPIATLTTEIHEDPGHVSATTFDLGDSVHDRATITFVGGGTTPADSEVTFQLLKSPGPNCSITGGTTIVRDDDEPAAGLSSGGYVESPSSGALHAGSYAYKVTFTSGNPALLSNAGPVCERFTVNKANTRSVTEVHKPPHVDVTNQAVDLGTPVHDMISVSGRVDGFPFTGEVDFRLFYGSSCGGTPITAIPGELNVPIIDHGDGDPGTAESAARTLPGGAYSYRAEYNSDPNYNDSTARCERFYIVGNAVTSSSLCLFDVDPAVDGSQFRLIFTPDAATGASKLNASNPGQIFYNVFHYSTDPETVTLTLPYPFITQGAMPIHIYSGVTGSINGTICYTPGTETGALGTQVTLADYIPPAFGGLATVWVNVPAGFSYINFHLNYGLKGTTGYTASNKELEHPNACLSGCGGGDDINNNTGYTFGFGNANSGFITVYNENVFKNDPGIGGLVTKAGTGDPATNVQVQIYDSKNALRATVYSDADGWYMWAYKYTGKAATFTVKLPVYNLSQTVTLKSNGYLVVNFVVP
ncbi:MAG: hypothetical protein HY316_01185 [Acidobacteria bacterium]|nr:hypothetical protein [Acidobacteriota bacterium]